MNKYKFKLLTLTGLGHEYFYCYGDDHFEQWLKRKNIKYEIDKKSINRFNKQKEVLDKIKKYINENEVCLIKNGIPEIKRSELIKLLEEIK